MSANRCECARTGCPRLYEPKKDTWPYCSTQCRNRDMGVRYFNPRDLHDPVRDTSA